MRFTERLVQHPRASAHRVACAREDIVGGLAAPTMFDARGAELRGFSWHVVQCVFLKQEAPGLDRPPYPGELGKRIYENVSKEAWARWLKHQTMLINEYRLSPIEPKARKFLEGEMEKFFFGAGSQDARRLSTAPELNCPVSKGIGKLEQPTAKLYIGCGN
jgi:Fe-S cluster biosynthesis and repair protein YggX